MSYNEKRASFDDDSSERTVTAGSEGSPVPPASDFNRAGVTDPDPKAPVPLRSKDFGFLPIPKRQRHDPAVGFKFTTLLNAVFGFASTFTVANLYYCQPILIELSESFGVDYERISNIPTLTQAGYATGLLFVTPLGDMVRRRELLLALLFLAGCFTLGLASVKSLAGFEALSYIAGIVAVTPQVMLPFAADLAPPHRRASALSIVLAGLLLGILIARVLSGIIAQYSSWRNVYWMSSGLHFGMLLLLWTVLPDYPDKNLGLSYFKILWTMAKFAVTEPVLIQSCFIGCASSAVFSSFWVTLTFLLGGPPYNYSTLLIGIFGLVGILGVCCSPLTGRIVDKLVPWFGTLFGLCGLAVSLAIYTGGASMSIGAVVVSIFILDVSQQMQQVSNSTRNFAVNPAARARINSVYIIYVFIGQVMGSSVGTRVFVQYGQRATGGLMLAYVAFAIVVLMIRGPEAKTWLGWTGDVKSFRRHTPKPGAADPEKVAPAVSQPELNTHHELNTQEDRALEDEPETAQEMSE